MFLHLHNLHKTPNGHLIEWHFFRKTVIIKKKI